MPSGFLSRLRRVTPVALIAGAVCAGLAAAQTPPDAPPMEAPPRAIDTPMGAPEAEVSTPEPAPTPAPEPPPPAAVPEPSPPPVQTPAVAAEPEISLPEPASPPAPEPPPPPVETPAAATAPRADVDGEAEPVAAEPQADVPADYTIAVRLDPETHRLHGTEVLRYTNRSPDMIPDVQFHLYLNAFKNEKSTFMRESGGRLRSDTMEEDGWGWIDVHALTLNGTDATAQLEFIQPDGTDPRDQTVARVPLAQPLAPGQTLEIGITFEAQLPKVFARTGYRGEYVLAGQWFPKVGVWETAGARGRVEAGWNCHQFHATTEFYADFNSYAVELNVPNEYVVGATGVESARDVDVATTTYTFRQDRVIDFAWTASPRFVREERVFTMGEWVSDAELHQIMELHGLTREQAALPDVTMILLLQPEHAEQADRYFQALATAIKYFGLWYGPYPYATITLVDPAWNARGSGGMEYPTFITGRTRLFAPRDTRGAPEGVTIHEFGHQYWQSMVATNEFEEAWLDEGLNSYSTGRILDQAYEASAQYFYANELPVPVFRWLGFANITQAQFFRAGPILDRGGDRIAQRAWEFRTHGSYGVNSYPKTAAVLRQLEHELGEDVMARVLRTYFQQWQFHHPAAADFIAIVEEVSGRDLSWFFDALLFGTGTVDYAVTDTTSDRLGFEAGVFDPPGGRVTITTEQADEQRKLAMETNPDGGPYRHTIVITNHGSIAYPVDILVRFADGEEVHERWDGAYRWVRYTYERDAKLERVVVDPEGRLLVDLNHANNSYVAEPERHAGRRWAAHVLLLVQRALRVLGALTI